MLSKSTNSFALSCLLLIFGSALAADNADTSHRLVTQGNGKLAIVNKDGAIECA